MKTLVQTLNGYKIYQVVEGKSKFHYVAKVMLNRNNVEIEMVEYQSKTLKACVTYANAH